MAKLVSQAYGEALFALAREADAVSQTAGELEEIRNVLTEWPQYRALFLHPRLDTEQKMDLFEQVFAGRVSPLLCGFAHTLLEKGRFGDLPAVADCFTELRLAYEKIGVVRVESPMELTGAQKEKIEKKLLETTNFVSLQVNYEIEPSLIGGLRIRIGDRVVDSSIRSKLDAMKRELMKVQLGAGGKETGA